MASGTWYRRRKRIFEIVEIGAAEDRLSRSYDVFNILSILVNLAASILYTFQDIRAGWEPALLAVEAATVAYFAADYALRLWTAKVRYPKLSEGRALARYVFSFNGIVDFLSVVPYYLPIFFPTGAVAFRLFRLMRVFELFRVNAYYDAMNIITEVISSKRQQLFSSVFILLVLMAASSLCMYSLEHEAQPEVFANAFSGIWWSVSTLLTIGYGDIYPITTAGKVFSIFITFLGVGMVAIPTGIISAGFVDQYSRIKRISEYANEEDIHFIRIHLSTMDRWNGQAIKELGLPSGVIVAAIRRNEKIIVPRGDVALQAGDTLVLGAESYDDDKHIDLKELVLRRQHPWNGQQIKDLDISRQTIIILVKRKKRVLIPRGDLVLMEGDKIILYTQMNLSQANSIQL